MMRTTDPNPLPQPLDIKNLSSRKLLELVRDHRAVEQHQAIATELQQRRHYLEELRQVIALDSSAVRH